MLPRTSTRKAPRNGWGVIRLAARSCSRCRPAASRLRTEGCAATASRKAGFPSRILSSSPASEAHQPAGFVVDPGPRRPCAAPGPCTAARRMRAQASEQDEQVYSTDQARFVPAPSTGAVVRLTAQLPDKLLLATALSTLGWRVAISEEERCAAANVVPRNLGQGFAPDKRGAVRRLGVKDDGSERA